MRIIPVIDLLSGQVVRGVGGRRDEYRPISSRLVPDSTPPSVARALVETLGAGQVYVADLDAIRGAEPTWQIYRDIASAGLRIWLDAGLATTGDAQKLLDFDPPGAVLSGIVAGLETVRGPDELSKMVTLVGPERLIFSLDLVQGRPLNQHGPWAGQDALTIADAAISTGVRQLIILDLAQVGNYGGTGTADLCRELRLRHVSVQLVAGGGIRDGDDLRSLVTAGCDAALVASALHDGRLTTTLIHESGCTL